MSAPEPLVLRPGEMTLPKTITFHFDGEDARSQLTAILNIDQLEHA